MHCRVSVSRLCAILASYPGSQIMGEGKGAWWLLLCACAKFLSEIPRICRIFHIMTIFDVTHNTSFSCYAYRATRMEQVFSSAFLLLQRLLDFSCRQCWLSFPNKRITNIFTRKSLEYWHQESLCFWISLWTSVQLPPHVCIKCLTCFVILKRHT